ncbi:MAG: RdgB/HAM1 family non-canonical purine NTP pyrophosphatase [Pseudomonadota bacterium]
MPRRLADSHLVIASHNPGKLREIAALMAPFGIAAIAAGDLGLAAPEESGTSFEDNATLKAGAASRGAGRPAIGDDSGLVVPALGGRPGLNSARWAGPERDFSRAMRRLEAALAGASDRRAFFVAALALAWPDGQVETFRGEVHGRLVWPPRGEHGFGYDPMFVPDGHEQTFAEMEPAAKRRIGHRGVAFRKLAAALFPPLEPQ